MKETRNVPYHQSYSDHTHQTEVDFSASFLAVVLLWCGITPLRHKRRLLVTDILKSTIFFPLPSFVFSSVQDLIKHYIIELNNLSMCAFSLPLCLIDWLTFSHDFRFTFSSSQVAQCVAPGLSIEFKQALWLLISFLGNFWEAGLRTGGLPISLYCF